MGANIFWNEWKSLDFQDFCNVEFILCLPGSTASVEKIFSITNSMWCTEKSRLSVESMRAMLIVRQNCNMECDKFYDKVLKDRNLLREVKFVWKILMVCEWWNAVPLYINLTVFVWVLWRIIVSSIWAWWNAVPLYDNLKVFVWVLWRIIVSSIFLCNVPS
jgi:hypothetical protein